MDSSACFTQYSLDKDLGIRIPISLTFEYA